MSGYFGKYYSQIDSASHSAKRSVLGLWCQGIQTLAKGRQVCPVHTDMGPCGFREHVFFMETRQKNIPFLILSKHRGQKAAATLKSKTETNMINSTWRRRLWLLE